jgi:hypothetical protein
MKAAGLLLLESTVSYRYYRTCHHPNGAGQVRKYSVTMLVVPYVGLFGDAVNSLTTHVRKRDLGRGARVAGVWGNS